jgi:hypothetical protein
LARAAITGPSFPGLIELSKNPVQACRFGSEIHPKLTLLLNHEDLQDLEKYESGWLWQEIA